MLAPPLPPQAFGATVEHPAHDLAATWTEVLDQLAAQLDAEALAIWLAPSRLLVLEHDTAVLGTPNVFVRDAIETHYRTVVEAAVRAVVGRPLLVELVIGTTLALP